MQEKSVVLLSSGLDSSVNMYQAARETQILLALTFDYGQRAAQREIACAQKLASGLKVPHQIIDLTWFSIFTRTALLNRSEKLPQGGDVDIGSMDQSKKTAARVWVPNRNGIFLNVAAGFAEGLGAKLVIPGFNAEEAATFPDNSQGFIDQLNQSFKFSTASGIRAHCYTTALEKVDIVRLGRELAVPFSNLWPCYEAEKNWCGQCESCLRFNRAMKEA